MAKVAKAAEEVALMSHKKPPSPRRTNTIRHLEHRIHQLHEHLERLTMTAADLQTAVDTLKTAVTKIQEQIAALKAQAADSVPQAQLDANTTDITAAASTLQGL